MLFSFSDPLRAALFLSFFLSLFFPPFSPQWGSPPDAGQEVGLLLSSGPPPRLSPSSLVYIPLPLFGDLKVPPLCGVQTLSPSHQRKKAGPTHCNSFDLTLTIICWVKAMSALVCLHGLFSSSFVLLETEIVLHAYLAAVAKVGDFFLIFLLRHMGGHEGGKRKERHDDRGNRERERWAAWRERGNICLKTCLHLAMRNVTRGICWKTPGGTDLHGGLS